MIDDLHAALRYDAQAVREVARAPYVRAVVLTDRSGNVISVHPETPSVACSGPLVELTVAALASAGVTFALGELRVSANVYEQGALIVGRTEDVDLAIFASHEGNLGQLLHAVRLVFPNKMLI
jgi:hypothetical protein